MWKTRSGRLALTTFILMLLGIQPPPALAQPLVMGILPLRYRTAEQMVPLVRPLVPPPGTVSGIQNQLIVHTTPQNLAEIRAVLERIDTLPRRLLISVRQDADTASAADGVTVSGRAASGRGEVSIGNPPPGTGAGVQVYSTTRSGSDRANQQVQALEGQPAMIHAGRSIPVPVRQIVRGPAGVQAVDSVEYREVSTGFQVVARLSGDEVILDILPQRQSVASGPLPGSVDTQQIATTVRGRLGEWIDLGGSARSSDDRQSVLLGRAGASAASERRVLVKVEELR
ncbi:MAG: secretin N-terminal domain-containing protein [Pseudomonadota bacterium]